MNGNLKTGLMHLLVFHELNRLRVNHLWPIQTIWAEKSVLLSKNGSPRPGRFDFLVETPHKTIGIEVLTRPSPGKLRQKMVYSSEVDEFVFVLPKNSLSNYSKSDKKIAKPIGRTHSLGRQFSVPSLKAWIVDLENGCFVAKTQFDKIFNAQ